MLSHGWIFLKLDELWEDRELALLPHLAGHQSPIQAVLLSGVFLGVVLVFVRERADRTLKQPGDSTYPP